MAGERVSAVGMICKTHITSVRAGESGEAACFRIVAEFKERFGRLPGNIDFNGETMDVVGERVCCGRPIFAAPGRPFKYPVLCPKCVGAVVKTQEAEPNV